MQITVKLKGHASLGNYPDVRIWVNDEYMYDAKITEFQTLVFDVEYLKQDNKLTIEHYNKLDSDTIVVDDVITEDRAVELVALSFNGIPVLDTVLYDKPYYVNWSEYWHGERPEFVKNTLYFGWNGSYVFDFTDNVEYDYFKQFWIDEQQAHRNQNSNEFYRNGEYVEVERGTDATIFDLERIIMSNHN